VGSNPTPSANLKVSGPETWVTEERLKIIVCHSGHENDACYTENIFEFLSENGVDHDSRLLGKPFSHQELAAYQGCSASLLGFNSQIDHSWIGDEPLILAAGRHGIPVVQWILDHPSGRWPEFNYSNPGTSKFLFNSTYSQRYFERFCCPGATTAVAGSVGPSRRSRSAEEDVERFSQRPVFCLIALAWRDWAYRSVRPKRKSMLWIRPCPAC
jgi:hypothetical protein